ncbi:metallophosphoesterase [Jiella sp. MQZ9-1]|uniref:Serine/threonine protein phosphatase n=1 Tax=Jiella flava TaxID=2816857 RepID=A0A939FXE1_9HYPH|nr:metallophosphoesterase [Jiella flava]MBO0662634.1 serine/threonine protein phosphatase [Jiella flava]MCD2471056.1 metallophosphoesterase [Jiella flava]
MADRPQHIVAIGDVHGEQALLQRFLDGVDALAERKDVQPAIYLLGDLVDRGPDSRGVMELATRIIAERPGSKLLIGNHDEWFHRFLADDLMPEETAGWLDQGGFETLRSYEVANVRDLEDLRRAIHADWPSHISLLEQASTIECIDTFAFVHAGIDPQRAISAQRREDCLWIRGRFMNHVGKLSHIVVHGHTPQKGGLPTVTENRLSLDTGAVFTGKLSGAWLDREAHEVTCLQVENNRALRIVEPRRLDRGLGTAALGAQDHH